MMKSRKKFRITNYISLLTLSGVAIGAIGGFLYYYFIGCQTGTCAITSNPWMSMLWGAAMGYLIFDMFKKKKAINQEKSE